MPSAESRRRSTGAAVVASSDRHRRWFIPRRPGLCLSPASSSSPLANATEKTHSRHCVVPCPRRQDRRWPDQLTAVLASSVSSAA